jgi:hypothetical protein
MVLRIPFALTNLVMIFFQRSWGGVSANKVRAFTQISKFKNEYVRTAPARGDQHLNMSFSKRVVKFGSRESILLQERLHCCLPPMSNRYFVPHHAQWSFVGQTTTSVADDEKHTVLFEK